MSNFKNSTLPRQIHFSIFILFLGLALNWVSACDPAADNSDKSSFSLKASDYELSCDPIGDAEGALSCQLAYYTNRQRNDHPDESDLADPLNWSDDLSEVARDYSRTMCDEGFFDHDDPHGNGMESRFQEAGILFIKAGENLARGSKMLPDQAMTLFMNEPHCEQNHRSNVLDNDFTNTGVGVYFCGSKTIYTQLFATFDAEDLREDINEFCSN